MSAKTFQCQNCRTIWHQSDWVQAYCPVCKNAHSDKPIVAAEANANTLVIPENWTFKNANVAGNFDAHVREQLPWYDLATRAVVHLGRHYVTPGGLVYDIGASTGNITLALQKAMPERRAKIVAIEESAEMYHILNQRVSAHNDTSFISLQNVNAIDYDYQQYDFAVAFLTLMFFPVATRRDWVNKMTSKMKPGGALVIVDKIVTPPGYVGTALRRMAMSWKIEAGVPAQQVVEKELSLAGYQRPINPHILDTNARVFFTLGEFVGWIIERAE